MAICLRKPREGSAPAGYAEMACIARLLVLATCAGILFLHTNLAVADLLIGPGEDNFDREVGSINGGGYTLSYELFLPPDHEEEGSLPLIVYLHGWGDGRDFKKQRLNDTIEDLVYTTQRDNTQRGVAPALAPQMDQQYEAYLLVPKIPVAEGWYDRLSLARQLMNQAISDYEIDMKRIYVAGFSNGGFAMPDMIAKYPDTFAAGVSFSGGGFPDAATAAVLKEVPQWYFHDKTDQAVSYDCSTNIVNALLAAGGSPKLTLYEGGYGHDSWEPALRDEDNTFYPWLFSQTLVPEPSVWVLLLLGAASFMMRRGSCR